MPEEEITHIKYEPGKWSAEFRMNPVYVESVKKFAEISEKSIEEADAVLIEKMLRIMLIEKHLALNGQQNAKTLFENIREFAVLDQQVQLFETEEDVANFCDEHAPVFLLHRLTRKYRNSGEGFRKFCVFVRRELEKGTIIDMDNIRQIAEKFKAGPDGYQGDNKFLKNELFTDLRNLYDLKGHVPRGFVYEQEPKTQVKLVQCNPQEVLALHLPIMAEPMDRCDRRCDTSRSISVVMAFQDRVHPGVYSGHVIDHANFDGVRAAVPETISSNITPVMLIDGHIRPYSTLEQIVAYRAAPYGNRLLHLCRSADWFSNDSIP